MQVVTCSAPNRYQIFEIFPFIFKEGSLLIHQTNFAVLNTNKRPKIKYLVFWVVIDILRQEENGRYHGDLIFKNILMVFFIVMQI